MYYPSIVHWYDYSAQFEGPGTFSHGKFLKSGGSEMEFSAMILTENCCNRAINQNNFIIRTPSPIYFLSKNS